jgi:FtsP/CotA-like multicopper oxidase with cupredoxin domain
MSKAGRWGLVALAVAVVVAAFLIARPGDDDGDSGNQASDDAPAATETAPAGDGGADTSPTATAPSAPAPPPDASGPAVIELRDHAVVGDVADVEVTKGDRVRLVVRSTVPDEIHVHGYDISRAAAPGKPARFSFPATIEGIFEIESHEAEHAGKDALIGRLVVEPS